MLTDSTENTDVVWDQLSLIGSGGYSLWPGVREADDILLGTQILESDRFWCEFWFSHFLAMWSS